MPATHETPSGADLATELVTWVTGLGIVTMAIFPFLIPGLIVLAIFALPLLVVPLVGALVAAVIAVPWLGVRALRRRVGRNRRRAPAPEPAAP
jgi:hypothetical protein